MARETLDSYVAKAQRLLPAPHILPQLLSLLNRPETNNSKIVELISFDSPLTAGVMRVCNSAYYNRGAPIDSLHHAVTHIGLNETYRIVVAITGSLLLSQSGKGRSRTHAHKLWDHSATTALAAQILAQDAGESEDVVFTAALLHDIGKMVFAVQAQDLYEDPSDARPSVEAEQELFGLDHAELGGGLLEAWRFPTSLVAAVRFHHRVGEAMTFKRLAACVCLGDSIAHALSPGHGHQDPPWQGRQPAIEVLNLSPERLADYVEEIRPRLQRLKDLYKLRV